MIPSLHSSGDMLLSLVATTPITPPKPPKPVRVEDYLFLAEIVARKFYRGPRHLVRGDAIKDTDLYSIACEELVKAAANKDDALGDFSRYAFQAMKNGVRDQLRRQRAKKRTAKFEELTRKDWHEVPLFDEDDGGSQPLPVDKLPEMLADCEDDSEQDKEDKRLLIEIYLQGKHVTEIAEKRGITRVTCYNRVRRIIGKIRQRHAAVVDKYKAESDESDEG